MKYPSYDTLFVLMGRAGLHWFEEVYDLNLVALRTRRPATNDDAHRDVIAVAYRDGLGNACVHAWPCSTVPGIPTLRAPENAGGAALIAPGAHRWYEPGVYKGKPCLRPTGDIAVLRDDDHDTVAGNTRKPSRSASCLIHAGPNDPRKPIGAWSAGCIDVCLRGVDTILDLVACQKSAGHGSKVTLNLIELEA